MAAIKTAFDTNKGLFSGNVTISFPVTGDIIDDTTGALTGVWSASVGGTVTGNNAGNPLAGVGACIGWSTGGIVVGKKGPRKLRGRTFIVPLSSACADSDGTLTTTALGQLDSLAAGIQGAGPLAVWHRPTTAGGSDGNSYGVIAHKVRDKVAFLSSRRD